MVFARGRQLLRHLGRLAGRVMSSHGLTPAQIRQRVRASRLAQGLPEHIIDPVALRDIAVMLTAPIKAIGRQRRIAAA
jgi:hypothetical protein